MLGGVLQPGRDRAGARYWGGSRVLDPSGAVVAEAGLWEPELLLADIDVTAARRRRQSSPFWPRRRRGSIAREVARLIDEGGDA